MSHSSPCNNRRFEAKRQRDHQKIRDTMALCTYLQEKVLSKYKFVVRSLVSHKYTWIKLFKIDLIEIFD